MKTEKNFKCLATELRLKDVVRLDSESYADAVVYAIKDGKVFLKRPYMHTSEVEYAGPLVIAYIGLEDFSVNLESDRRYLVACRLVED